MYRGASVTAFDAGREKPVDGQARGPVQGFIRPYVLAALGLPSRRPGP